MKLRWPVYILLGVLVALGAVWLYRQSKAPMPRLAPLPERTREEREKEQIRVTAAGYEMEAATVRLTKDGWAVYIQGEADGTDVEKLYEQSAALFRGLDRLDVTFADLGLILHTNELKDAFGHELSELPVLEIGLSKDTFERIDWEGFEPKNFPRVADRFWVHEELIRLSEEKKAAETKSDQGETPDVQSGS